MLDGLETVTREGAEVVVPPLHHRIVTARVTLEETAPTLRDARESVEQVLTRLEVDYPATPAGLGVTVAWGLPYFGRYAPGAARREIPVDLRATSTRGREVRVLEEAGRFPSDPADTRLESNDVAVLLRSDRLDAIDDAQARLFDDLPGIFSVTSVRKGFVGRSTPGEPGLPKQIAVTAGIPGSELIPSDAQLFLGFTSTVKAALGPPQIVNFETLGYASLPSSYFVGGTHLHLSHLREDLLAWYLNLEHGERVTAMFRPGLESKAIGQTHAQLPSDTQTLGDVRRDYARRRRIGHAGSIQTASRLQTDIVAPDGTVYSRGTAVPHRSDFNTLDNPFAWSASSVADRMVEEPAAGVHFLAFNPSSDDFRRVRLAMDGVLPDGSRLPLEPRSQGQGINAFVQATHRQNFIVPPRKHRRSRSRSCGSSSAIVLRRTPAWEPTR